MSNYTKQINWSGKDALPDSDPNKVISGDLFDTEFTAVQTALNSKADLEGSATQAFNALTASAGTSTNQTATTEFVTTAIDAIPEITAAAVNDLAYPVDSIYTSISPTNPSTLLGVGTWVRFAQGRTLVGQDSGQSEFDVVEETGGAKTHTLTEDETPAHQHVAPNKDAQDYNNMYGTTTGAYNYFHDTNGYTSNASGAPLTSSVGGGSAHNNLQPYITVYFWKRTA